MPLLIYLMHMSLSLIFSSVWYILNCQWTSEHSVSNEVSATFPPCSWVPCFWAASSCVCSICLFSFFFIAPLLIWLRTQRFSGRFCDWKRVIISHIRFWFSKVGVVLYGFTNSLFIWFSKSRPRFVNHVLWCLSSEIAIGDLSPRQKRWKHSKLFSKLGMFATSAWFVLNCSVSYLFPYICPIDLFYPLVSLLTHTDCRLHAHAVNVVDDGDSDSPHVSSLVLPFVSNIFLLTNVGCRSQVPAVNTNDNSDSDLPTISS